MSGSERQRLRALIDRAKRERSWQARGMCACGCHGRPKLLRSRYLPGHDMRAVKGSPRGDSVRLVT